MKPDEEEPAEALLAELLKVHALRARELHEQLSKALSNILLGEKIPLDVVNAQTGEVIIPANHKITMPLLRKVAGIYDRIDIDPSPIRVKIREIIGPFEKFFSDLERERQPLLEKTPAYRALVELRQLAQSGDAQAQFDLGCFYFTGTDLVKRDLQKAKSFFSEAAGQGNAGALVMLGDDCANRWFELRNRDWSAGISAFREAVRWYCEAAASKDAQAQYRLAGLCSAFKEPADARYGFAELCSEYLIPVFGCCDPGDGFRFQFVFKLYSMAAEQEHLFAQTAVGDCFADGIGVDQARDEAAKWYRKAAERGDAEAQRKLGDCYDQRWVVSSDPKENMESYRSRQAVKWYRKAAEQGDFEAQKKLAQCYAGGFGVAKNEILAAKWYGRAGMQGDGEAYEELGELYAEMGDKRRAARYYRKAGLNGWSSQIRNLGPKRTW